MTGPLLVILALAVGLAMDAVAVAAAEGAARRPRLAGALCIGLTFGAAQGLMPLIGATLGLALAGWFQAVDHWVALVLLSVLGVRMVRAGLAGEDAPDRPLVGWALVTAAVATSIDAAAAGLALPAIGVPIPVSCLLIALVTAGLATGAAMLGGLAGARFGDRAEIVGGLVLVAIGIGIFVEHQFVGG